MTLDKTTLDKLSAPFAPEDMGKLPKPTTKDGTKGKCPECNGYHQPPAIHIDYVGHAAITKRLLEVDPDWSWEPFAVGADGLPSMDRNGGMWIRLTIGGKTLPAYGDAQGKTGGNAVKETIGDALRNGAMRFGVALELWHKGEFADPIEDKPEVDWLTEAQNAPSAETTLAVWQMARANGCPLEVLDKIATLGTERRATEAQKVTEQGGTV